MTWSQIPALCAVLALLGLVLANTPWLLERLAQWLAARHVRDEERTRQRAQQAVDVLAAAAPRERLALPAGGRHRRDEGGPDAVSATGIMRALNLSAEQLPAIPRGVVKR